MKVLEAVGLIIESVIKRKLEKELDNLSIVI
jgi:hypothetical protein